ncbi:MAG: glycosyltransferase [FCB group bacterium]|nr:glycosyltransferase [FCB group bacterium]
MKTPFHVVHVLEATEGGARRWLETVVEGLDANAVRTSCICSFRREADFRSTAERIRAWGVTVWEVDMRRSIHPVADARALRRMVEILAAHPCDLLHGHCAKGGMLARMAGRLAGIPCVYSPHAFPYLCGGAASGLYRILEWLAIPATDALMAVSEAEAREAVRLGHPAERVHTVLNGVACPREALWRGPSPRAPLIGTLSALRPQKDPHTFLEACAIVHRARPEARFRLCGAGPLEGDARKHVAALKLRDCIEMPGRVSREFAAIETWDVFVLSSRYEGLSLALLEAMAAGVPVVVTDVPGNAEVVRHERSGLVVPAGDPVALAGAVLRLLDEPALARGLAEAARRRVLERYGLGRQLGDLMGLYRAVLEGQGERDGAGAWAGGGM